MPQEPIRISPQHGIQYPGAKLNRPLGAFRQLLNCRLTRGRGAIEQTPPFFTIPATYQHTQGTYYDAGSQTEPLTAQPSLIIGAQNPAVSGPSSPINSAIYVIGRYAAYSDLATQLQVIKQTSYPATATLYTGCLLTVTSFTTLGVNLGSALDVEMTGAAAFRWRVNGGGWTAGVPSTAGAAITGGVLYFLANTGYAGTEVWAWTRTDWFTETTGTHYDYDWSYVASRGKIYFRDGFNRIMVIESGGIRSVGYRPVFGTHLAVFDDHLIVGNYSVTANNSNSGVVGWSDKSDYDDFFATDVNEADTDTLPGGVLPSDNTPVSAVCGLWVNSDVLYVFAVNGIYWTLAYGLPVVFSFKFKTPIGILRQFAQPVLSDKGIYLLTQHGIDFYNGETLQHISEALDGLLEPYFTATSRNLAVFYTGLLWGGYDGVRNEVYFYHSNVAGSVTNFIPFGCTGFIVFQEHTGEWYFRAAAFSSPSTTLTMMDYFGRIYLGYKLGVMLEDVNYSNGAETLIKDFNGVSFQPPTIETHDLTFEELVTVHEHLLAYADMSYDAATGAYDPAGVEFYNAMRAMTGSTVTYVKTDTWLSTDVDGALEMRTAGRIGRLKLIAISSGATKVTKNFIFNELVLNAYNLRKKDVRR